MQTSNRELISNAYQSLKGKWSVPMGAFLIYLVVLMPIVLLSRFIPIAGVVVSWIVIGPLLLGFTILTLNVARNKAVSIGDLFSGFRQFFKAVIATLIVSILVAVGSALLIIPGFFVLAHLALVLYILADEPDVAVMDALKRSSAMMSGYKWKFVKLILMCMGLFLLGLMTLGIGLLWIIPIIQVSIANFYDDVKVNSINQPI